MVRADCPGAAAGEADPEEIAIIADEIGKFLNENYVLQPMPQLQAGDIPARLKKLGGECTKIDCRFLRRCAMIS